MVKRIKGMTADDIIIAILRCIIIVATGALFVLFAHAAKSNTITWYYIILFALYVGKMLEICGGLYLLYPLAGTIYKVAKAAEVIIDEKDDIYK